MRSSMIVCVAGNPSVDKLFEVEDLVPGGIHRPRSFLALPGGPQTWRGEGVDEKGICRTTGEVLVQIDPRYFRPTEVDLLIGNPAKAHAKLGWRHETDMDGLLAEMVSEDLKVMATAPVMRDA